MTRSKTLLIFPLVISVFGSKGEIQSETAEFIRKIATMSEQRSLILIHNALENFPEHLYKLELPIYNINLADVKKFNGKYNSGYHIETTYEESKLYFIFMTNLQDIYVDLPIIRKIYFWRDRDKAIVFVNGNYSLPELKESFLFCYQFYIVNIVFAFLGDKIEAFSYNPFKRDYSLFMENPGNLFPDKFQNLHGYRLRISMFPTIINRVEGGKYNGADGLMSRTIAHHLNTSYTYVEPRVSDEAPVLNQYRDVAERLTDVGFNTRYIKFNFKNLIEKVYPHDRDDLTILIPKITMKKFNGLRSLLDDLIWFLALATSIFFFFFMLASTMISGRKVNIDELVIMIVALLLNKPVQERQELNFRLGLMSYLIFSIFLNTLILCRWTSIFTAPSHFHGIQTLKELAETKYEIITIDRFQELLNASLDSDLREKMLQRFTLIDEPQYLEEIRKCRDVVFICKDHLANYAKIQQENYPNGIQFYRIMKERILPTLSCYIVSYGSPFLKRFDELVRRIVEAGIYDYWKAKTWHNLGVDNEFRFAKETDGKTSPLSLDDISVAAKILLYGLGAALVMFLLEVLSIKVFKF